MPLATAFLSPLMAQDFVRLSERSLTGTARYVGMSGAMTAIGGDPCAALDNPAGLGLYRRSEVLFSLDNLWDRTRQNADAASARGLFRFGASQASLVISFGAYKEEEQGVLFNNIMFSYRRLQSFYRDMYARSSSEASLGSLLDSYTINLGIPYCAAPNHAGNILSLRESGSVNEYAFDWGMNISNQLYVGAGVHMISYRFGADADYYERFNYVSDDGYNCYNENKTSLTYSGIGCNLSAGVIYRPISWLRLGLSLQTPSVGSLNIYSRGTMYALADSLRSSTAPNLATYVRDFHMPFHLSTSVAFQWDYYGMLSLQYDYLLQSREWGVHSLRAGLEVVPITGLYINAGYTYESTFRANNTPVSIDASFDRQDTYFQRMRNTQYASVAIGFRGQHMIVQAAYQFRWQNINLYAHENAQPYAINTDTHRLVLTFGWHKGW